MSGISRQTWRLGGLAGIVAFVVLAAGFLSFQPPAYDDPAESLRSFWVDNGQQVLIVYYFATLALGALFLPFLVVFRALLGGAERGAEACSRIAFFGGLLAIVSFLVEGAFWGVLAFGDFAASASDETIYTLMLLDNYFFAFLPLGFGVLTLFSSVVIARTGVIWKWLAIPGAAIALLGWLAPLGILSSDSNDVFDVLLIVSFAASLVWLLFVSVAMVLKRSEPIAAA